MRTQLNLSSVMPSCSANHAERERRYSRRKPRSVAWRILAGMLLLVGSIGSLLAGCGASSSPVMSRASAPPTPTDLATLYAGFAAGYLIAFHASDGTVRWRNKGYTASPVIADGILYTGSGADLVALRPNSDGITEVWRVPLDSGLANTPVLRDGILYVNTSGLTTDRSAHNGSVYAVDTRSGHILWRFQTHGSMFGSPVVTDDAIYTSADTANVMSTLFALHQADGSVLWRVQRSEYISGLAVLGGTLYVGTTGQSIAALQSSDGKQIWSYQAPGFVNSLAVSDAGVVYVGARDNALDALRASDGMRLWTYQTGGSVFAPVTVRDGLVYVTSEKGYVAALDAATGNVRWRTCVDNDTCTTPGATVRFSTPLIASQTIYVGVAFVGTGLSHGGLASVAGGIYALDANTGRVSWQYQSGIVGGALGTPALADS